MQSSLSDHNKKYDEIAYKFDDLEPGEGVRHRTKSYSLKLDHHMYLTRTKDGRTHGHPASSWGGSDGSTWGIKIRFGLNINIG